MYKVEWRTSKEALNANACIRMLHTLTRSTRYIHTYVRTGCQKKVVTQLFEKCNHRNYAVLKEMHIVIWNHFKSGCSI